jgi:hypothetical protein
MLHREAGELSAKLTEGALRRLNSQVANEKGRRSLGDLARSEFAVAYSAAWRVMPIFGASSPAA